MIASKAGALLVACIQLLFWRVALASNIGGAGGAGNAGKASNGDEDDSDDIHSINNINSNDNVDATSINPNSNPEPNPNPNLNLENPYANVPADRLIILNVYPPINNADLYILELKPLPDGLADGNDGNENVVLIGSDIFPVPDGADIEAASFTGGPPDAYVECTIFTAPVALRDGVWDLVDGGAAGLGRQVTFSLYDPPVDVAGATGYYCTATFYGGRRQGENEGEGEDGEDGDEDEDIGVWTG